jgi:hypothetical protein
VNARERRHAQRAENRATVPTTALMRPALSKQPRAAKLTSTQRAGDGKRSDWSRPMTLEYRLTVTTGDRRWDQTTRNRSI